MQPRQPGMRPGMEMDQSPEQMINMRADMMKRMGVADDKIAQWKSVMGVQIQPDSPEGLVGLKEQLKLTDDQVKQLQTIEKDAQQKATGVLTAEQKTKLDEVKFKPGSVMELSTMMTREMRESRMGQRRPMEGMRPGAPGAPGAPAQPGMPMPAAPPAPPAPPAPEQPK